jgi:peptidyl-prolyl cis-trans isomerase A (cyclophilin A)
MTKVSMAVVLMVSLAAAALPAPASRAHAGQHSTQSAIRRSLYRPSSLSLKAPAAYHVKFITTQGDFVVEVTRAWAPAGADRFYNLVRHHFYSGASFFRVLPGFVAQFGISPNPHIARAWRTATIPDDPVTQSNTLGTLSFATAGPNTRTTQIFINLADNSRLDGAGFAPFGKVVEGMDVVEKFYSGYGEGAPQGDGPDQGRIETEGGAYLIKNFPKLDRIESTVIQRAAPRPVSH